MGQVLLARGVLAPAAGSGEQNDPASDATITIWTSSSNLNSSRGGGRFKRLILSIYSSHASATDGVEFEVSADGTNWRDLATYTLAATTLEIYRIAVAHPWVRVKFTNSTNTLTAWEMSLFGDTEERGLL